MPRTATIPRRASAATAAASAAALPLYPAVCFAPIESRAADGTRQRLCMEASIKRSRVFGGTLWAQRKLSERGVRPVVGQCANQRVARSALRAVDERVTIAPRIGVAQLRQTLIAGEQVRRDMYVQLLAGRARQNAKLIAAFTLHRPDSQQDRGAPQAARATAALRRTGAVAPPGPSA